MLGGCPWQAPVPCNQRRTPRTSIHHEGRSLPPVGAFEVRPSNRYNVTCDQARVTGCQRPPPGLRKQHLAPFYGCSGSAMKVFQCHGVTWIPGFFVDRDLFFGWKTTSGPYPQNVRPRPKATSDQGQKQRQTTTKGDVRPRPKATADHDKCQHQSTMRSDLCRRLAHSNVGPGTDTT